MITKIKKEAGEVICQYKAGKYKMRVAFKTEYGVIHTPLPDAITV